MNQLKVSPAKVRVAVYLIIASSQTEAEAIASALVQEQLAACLSIAPIQSVYRWQGDIHQDEEWQLMVKIDLTQFSAIAARVQQLHSYEVPEVIALPIVEGAATYLDWLAKQVRL
ncbi:MAG: divalent-cation tolerance protein CutA [Leptolyngbyaceae cyanobacterium SM1_1_3]|nr:divalent-cation tolerance protein CutA [Leptolyngbyaceae cyanobacterium SM1_1_3]NJN01443.1 divalent-cation tolerance protein CutA [Leptolyngbyaceae cyanobacterium RM1_1_2]NJO09547.1 divalent-cation tolerance protein CutA [Leptolyngbyaceae cyanobacterium SL_1_1]